MVRSAPRRAALAKGAGALASMALLAGCATPQPGLEGTEAVLHDPTQQALSDLAEHLQHPRLAPVTLDFSRPLTPRELAVIAVVSNPDLKSARAKASLADAQVFNAGLLPDPQINLSYGYRLSGPDPYNGMAGAVIYELMQLRQRSTVLAGQKAAARQARLDLAWQELQTAGQAELLGARIVGLTHALQYAQRTEATTDGVLQRSLLEQAKGDLRSDEVETRRIAASDASAAVRVAEIALDTARHDLNKLLGLSPDAKLIIADPEPVQAPTDDPEVLFQRAKDQRLDLQALQAGYESQNATVRKAMMDAFPSLQLTVARTQDTAKNQTVDPALNFTLPLWNRNRGGIAIAKATQDQLRAEYSARLFTARADIADLVSQLRVEAQQRDGIERQIAPIRPIVDATEAAAKRGDLSLAAAETARQSLSDKELALVTLNQSMAEQRVTLALAVGGPLLD